MKAIKVIFVLFVQILCVTSFGQNAANAEGKIHFIYHKKSNFYINEKGLYADTTSLKRDFTHLKYSITKHPEDSTKTVGFIDLKFLSKSDQKRIISIFGHSNYKYDCYYNIKKNQTAMYITRIDNDEVHDLLKKLFSDTYSSVYFNRVYINYNKSEKPNTIAQYGMYRRKQESLFVKWYDENRIGGEFKVDVGPFIYTDLIIANPKLERHVTPYILFKNCEYGIQKLITYYNTIDLVSVTYE